VPLAGEAVTAEKLSQVIIKLVDSEMPSVFEFAPVSTIDEG
jgi:hypothetical protein